MYASIRRYEGNQALVDALLPHEGEVLRILREIAGFRAYYLVRTADGAVSVTVCDDQAGAEESNRAAAEWVRANVPEAASSPTVSAGEVAIAG
jgi:hypothetical protein